MKPIRILAILAGTVVLTTAGVQAQTNTPAPGPVTAAETPEAAALNKHIKPVLAALQLTDAAAADKVHDILAGQLKTVRAWHAENDARLKPLWNAFNKARSAQNVTNANAALAQIDAIYAAFKPQHDKFLADLAAVLSPAQVETVKDVLTVDKVKVTYNVYTQIFPTLTDAQKAVVLQDLKAAREQAIDCESMVEKSAFFKKYKILIEDDYLTGQGYDPKQARKDFAAKAKADGAEKKAATE
jgi:hypothetical protein